MKLFTKISFFTLFNLLSIGAFPLTLNLRKYFSWHKNEKIVGGQNAEQGQFPYQVRLRVFQKDRDF